MTGIKATPPLEPTELMDLDHYANQITQSALDAFLRADAQTLGHLVYSLRRESAVNPELFNAPHDADFECRARRWWDGRLPGEYEFLWQYMATGPVFASVSLHLAGAAPTLVLPVPAHDLFRRGIRGLRRSVWVNCPPDADLPEAGEDSNAFACVFSHAIANTAMEVRVLDKPAAGWIAHAHLSRKGLYIPDVRAIADLSGAPARTAACEEERFLAMASVLYMPFDYPKVREYAEPLPGVTEGVDPPAPAVLMLWSPVPGRWDHLGAANEGDAIRELVEGVWEVKPSKNAGKDGGWPYTPVIDEGFRWLDVEVAKEIKALRWAETQFLAPFIALHRAALHAGKKDHRRFVDLIGHGFSELARSLPGLMGPTPDPLRLGEWVARLVGAPDGPVAMLRVAWPEPWERKRRIQSASLILRFETTDTPRDLSPNDWYGEHERPLKELPEGLGECATEVVASTATALATELANNISAHAERILEIRIEITRRYVVAKYVLELSEEALSSLHGSEEAFRRYFAIRRGVVVPTAAGSSDRRQGGHGIGLALHSAVSSQTGVYSALYLAPGGAGAHATLAVPYKENKELGA